GMNGLLLGNRTASSCIAATLAGPGHGSVSGPARTGPAVSTRRRQRKTAGERPAHRRRFPRETAREDSLAIIGWIILGLIAGFIASKIVNKRGQGFLGDIVLGVIGAVIGGVIFTAVGGAGITGFNIYSLVVAVIGSVVVLVIYHAIRRPA